VAGRPVQVDPAAAPAAGWVAGEGGVAARSPPTGSRVTVEWLPVPATGPTGRRYRPTGRRYWLTPDTGYGTTHWVESDDSERLAFGRNFQSFSPRWS
jgi:hypothetical protein